MYNGDTKGVQPLYPRGYTGYTKEIQRGYRTCTPCTPGVQESYNGLFCIPGVQSVETNHFACMMEKDTLIVTPAENPLLMKLWIERRHQIPRHPSARKNPPNSVVEMAGERSTLVCMVVALLHWCPNRSMESRTRPYATPGWFWTFSWLRNKHRSLQKMPERDLVWAGDGDAVACLEL